VKCYILHADIGWCARSIFIHHSLVIMSFSHPSAAPPPSHSFPSPSPSSAPLDSLPPFGRRVRELLAQPLPQHQPLAFKPIEWVNATFPHERAAAGGTLGDYLIQFHRSVRDLSRMRAVSSDPAIGHALVLHALEGMSESYMGLMETVKEMRRYQENEILQLQKAEERRARRGNSMNGVMTLGGGVAAAVASSDMQVTYGSSSSLPSTATDSPTSSIAAPSSDSVSSPSTSSSSDDASTLDPPLDDRAAQFASMSEARESLIALQRHCVTTLRTLRNLHVLVCGVDVLRDIIADAEFQAARVAFQAITDIFATFDKKYHKLPILASLTGHVDVYKAHLRPIIFQTFRDHMATNWTVVAQQAQQSLAQARHAHQQQPMQGRPRSDTATAFISPKLHSLSRLHHCCRLIDLLYSRYERRDLAQWFCQVYVEEFLRDVERKQFGEFGVGWFRVGVQQKRAHTFSVMPPPLNDHPSASSTNPLAAFNSLDRLFSWLWKLLRDSYDGEFVQVFPRAWFVDALMARAVMEELRRLLVMQLAHSFKQWREENERRRATNEAHKARNLMRQMDDMRRTSNGFLPNVRELRRHSSGSPGRGSPLLQSISSSLRRQHSGSGSAGRNSPTPLLKQRSASDMYHARSSHSHSHTPPATSSRTSPLLRSSSGSNAIGSAAPLALPPLELDLPLLDFDIYRPLLQTIEFELNLRSRWLQEGYQHLEEDDLFFIVNPSHPTDSERTPSPTSSDKHSSSSTHLTSSSSIPSTTDPALIEALQSNPPPTPFAFGGFLSSAFHPYLPHLLLKERSRFHDFLEEIDAEDAWEVESVDIASCHYTHATKLFVLVSASMDRYAKVMPAAAFLDLFKEYRTAITNYIDVLSRNLVPGTELSHEEVSSLIATINTADYTLDRSRSLADTIVNMLYNPNQQSDSEDGSAKDDATEGGEGHFLSLLREQVDLSSVDESVSSLTHRATHLLASNIIRQLAPSLNHMKEAASATRNGTNSSSSSGMTGTIASVTDENRYVREIISSLTKLLSDKAKMSSFPYLCQVVVTDFLSLFYTRLRQVPFRVTEHVAQQMLYDLQSIKSFLISAIPQMRSSAQAAANHRRMASTMTPTGMTLNNANTSPSPSPSSPPPTSTVTPSPSSGPVSSIPAAFRGFVKLVHSQILPAENLLKTLTAPNARLIQTMKAINPKADAKAIQELLHLRGLSSSEQDRLIKSYNASIQNPIDQIPIVKKDFFGQMQQMVRDVKHLY